jgi:hypothetical protein
MDQYSNLSSWSKAEHISGTFPNESLKEIEKILPSSFEYSAETGCGKSTILFSNLAQRHKVFTIDDRNMTANSSVVFFKKCPLTKLNRIEVIFGPTQLTLPQYKKHKKYDVVLLDGPHGYPFPELEYFYFYPHIKKGGILIVDDVLIPTIGRMADFVAEDEMFELIEVISNTAVFRRTNADTFDPYGDGWWTQRFNRRRVSPKSEIFLKDGPVIEIISSQKIDHKING